MRDLSARASSSLQTFYSALPKPFQPHVDNFYETVQQYLPHHWRTKPAPGTTDWLSSLLSSDGLSKIPITVLVPLLILVFFMSSWWSSGRYSPFGLYNPRGPPQVTEDDFSYISGDDDRHRERHDGHPHPHHSHHDNYGPSRHASRADEPDLDPDVLILKHKGTTYPLHFPAFSISESLKVSDIRRAAAKETRCDDPRRVKLLYKGRSLRNDAKTCRDEGLKQNSELICVISSDTPIRHPDDGNESSSSASSTAIANGVEITLRGDNAPADRENRTKRKNHRGGSRRKNRDDQEVRYDEPPRERVREQSTTTANPHLAPPTSAYTNASGTDYRSPSPMHRAHSPSNPPQPQPTKSPPPAAQSQPKTPAETIDAISRTLQTEFLPKVRALLDNPPSDAKTRQYESKKLSEGILTQVLFKLDGVVTDDEAVKARRKECVKEANFWSGELDRLEKKN